MIEGGKVRKRKKGPSKQFREKFGHTPLSAEEIPWEVSSQTVYGSPPSRTVPGGGETALEIEVTALITGKPPPAVDSWKEPGSATCIHATGVGR